MLLNVSDASELLKTPENQIYRWVDSGELPCAWVNGRPCFNRAELLEWALSRKLPVDPERFQDARSDAHRPPDLAAALKAGGIHRLDVGPDRDAVLKAVVDKLPLPEDADRDLLLSVLLAREASSSTGVGGGIAIPHVRQPVALSGAQAAVALCFLEKPVDFKAPDGQPVHTLFFIVSPTIASHLQLLAQLAAALHDAAFKSAVLRQRPPDEIFAEAAKASAAKAGAAR
jgi:PTS system nitrogen regulatory IIA component